MNIPSLQRLWQSFCQGFSVQPKADAGAPTLPPDLVNRISHEMRTSLTGIVGYAEFIEQGSEPAMVNFTAKIIRESSQALARSVQSFVELQQVKQSPPVCSPFAVAKVIHTLVHKYQDQAYQRDVNLIFNGTQEAESLLLSSDEGRLTKMLEALIGSALDAATRGAVVVVGLGWQEPQQAVELALYELGGAAHPAQSKLLQQFWHDPQYVYKMQEGPGVDMALAKALLASLQGWAEFKTVPGQGDQLRLWLPAISQSQNEGLL